MAKNMKNTLVTGASTGIGYATVAAFVARGWRVWGTVRRAEDAERLQKEFGERFRPLILDVTDNAAVQRAAGQVAQELKGEGLDGLINNAGVALPGPVAEQPMEEIRKILEVNFFAPLAFTRAFLPLLGMREDHSGKAGRIINISSVAGKLSFPFLGAYAASKHALEGLSESLRRELMPWGISVVIVGPGSVRTPIWGKASGTSYDHTVFGEVYGNFQRFAAVEGQKGLPADEIARLLVGIMEAENPRTRYAPIPKKFANWTLPRFLPDKVLDGMVFKMMGMKKRNA